MSDPTPANVDSPAPPKRKQTKRTLLIVGCSFGLLLAFFLGPMLIVPIVLDRLDFAQHKKADIDIQSLMSAVETYAVNNGGAYPESLEALVVPDANGETYLKGLRQIPLDPWGNAYVYFAPTAGSEPRIVSYGKDGKPGGEGSDADIDSALMKRD
ncbi:MAG: type II secretion system protein GspG [Planctomycetaceae bacterium]|nr:type II secretion system protein GspG [Planctomycetaceae bacterium]